MPEEVNSIISLLKNIKTTTIGKRNYHFGILNNIPVVVVYSKIGKVAASITATCLISQFNVKKIIFTGVAGSVSDANIGDIVVGNFLYQYDMDASPLFEKYHIPLVGEKFTTTPTLKNAIIEVAKKVAKGKVWEGDIATADQFLTEFENFSIVKEKFPDILCVEMEGAAVAQVCSEYDLPFGIFRTISDKANATASIDFNQFIETVAGKYAAEIINHLVQEKRWTDTIIN
jgi:adenosylhomocysteine nucleosidase